jgi:hypothetical protein
MAKPAETDDSLKRLGGGRWQTRDERFTIEPQSGTWVVVDSEQTDDLGLARVRGPFGSLGAAKEAIVVARAAEPAESPLAAQLAKLRDRSEPPGPRRRPPGQRQSRRSRRPNRAGCTTSSPPNDERPAGSSTDSRKREPRIRREWPGATSSARSQPWLPSRSPGRSLRWGRTQDPWTSSGSSPMARTRASAFAGASWTATTGRSSSISRRSSVNEPGERRARLIATMRIFLAGATNEEREGLPARSS